MMINLALIFKNCKIKNNKDQTIQNKKIPKQILTKLLNKTNLILVFLSIIRLSKI